MESEIAAQTTVSVSTRDSRIVYISATAYGTPQPNLTDTLTRIISDIGSRLDYWQLYGDKFRLQVLNELSKYGYKVENVEVAVSYRCPNCGAAIELNPEAIIYVCKYCGWSGDIFGKNLKIYAWPTLPRQSVEQLVKRFTGGAKIVEADLKYVPYWIFKASLTVNYAAKVVYKVKRGKKYVRREANVGEKFEKEIVYPLVARLNAEFYGDLEMQGNVEYNFRKKPPKEVTSQEARNIAPYVLSPEISRDEAKEIIVDKLEDVGLNIAKDRAKSRFSNVESVHVYYYEPEIKVSDPILVMAPYWFIIYKSKGGIYSGAFSGIDGDLLKLEVPITPAERLVRLLGAWLVAALTGLGVEFFLNTSSSGKESIVIAVIGLGSALALTKSAFSEAKVRR
ncbi:MAG: hypothetical protein DRJ46_04300 [Thermoprotei archaeon]|nr:MAG: hypothetical protein DRJ46_04300 [Thermoprotei archaeon]